MTQRHTAVSEATYLETIRERLSAYFDFEAVPTAFADALHTWARFTKTDEKYFMSQKMNLYTVHTFQYVGIGTRECVAEADIRAAFETLKGYIHTQGPSQSTMSTEYTIALVSKTRVDAKAVQACLSQLKHHEGFAWGLKGWADAGFIVVDLESKVVYANGFARKQLKTVLWSFDGKPVEAPAKSWFSRIKLMRCGCCTG